MPVWATGDARPGYGRCLSGQRVMPILEPGDVL